jgi:branched-chain amino acid transport system permease protein
VSAAWQYYFITLLVYAGMNLIAVWGINLQFGLAGILNFAYIIFQSAGAYIGAVLALGPVVAGGFQTYILGANLPWPLPLLAGGAAGGLLSLVVGLVALRPQRIDYQGMALLTVGLIVTAVIIDYTSIFNGAAGLADVPKPFGTALNLSYVAYGWFFVGLTACLAGLMYFLMRRLSGSPWGRQLRAMRENPRALQGLGVRIETRRLQAFVVGGVFAGVSGALLVEFVGSWAPGAWTLDETFLFLVAVVIGGRGNNLGVAMGTIVTFTVVLEGVQYLPLFSYTSVAQALQTVVIGLAFIFFVAWKPSGLIPERPKRFGRGQSRAVPAPSEAAATSGGEVE